MDAPRGRWGLHWQAPSTMVAFFIFGVTMAVGHHLFYKRLEGKLVVGTSSDWDLEAFLHGQEWKIRFGTALAFLTQSLFAKAIDQAFQQTVWVAARNKAITVDGLDAMFSAGSSLLSFSKLEFLRKATLGALLGLLKWLIPLSALVTPATLTVIPWTSFSNSTKPVPAVNFSIIEPLYHFYESVREMDYGFLSNNGITPKLTRILSSAATSLQILPMKAIAPNSTYEMTFHGPSLRCSRPEPIIHEAIHLMVNSTYEVVYQWTPERFAQEMSWVAFAPTENIFQYVYLGLKGTIPLASNKTRVEFLKFARICILQGDSFDNQYLCEGVVGFDESNARNVTYEYMSTLKSADGSANYGRIWVWVNASTTYDCVLTDTEYSARFVYSESESMQRVDPGYNFTWTENDLYGSYFATAGALSNFLTGAIRSDSEGSLIVRQTRITESAIFGALNLKSEVGDSGPGLSSRVITPEIRALARGKTAGELIEELSRNFTLSLFSVDQVLSMNLTEAVVTVSSQANVYAYASRNLVITYAVTSALSLIAILVGLVSLLRNGVSHEIGFLAFLLTTRNPRLDNFTLDQSMGALPHSEKVKETKLRFGFIRGSNGNMMQPEWQSLKTSSGDDQGQTGPGRVGFGFENEVQPLIKGTAYL
ncbi:hypothetical protein QBC42DRAFT_299192 [Cladorrhinum samala]|uniref:Uncharacterized protein n=1 Tax=Cladorrhinum samala TaxID=585594 RepID=A0AAV9HFN0_9PEZI|nr:hypothetical protein QBC42DRAFT_299192 [Cladorrhinum samala]